MVRDFPLRDVDHWFPLAVGLNLHGRAKRQNRAQAIEQKSKRYKNIWKKIIKI